MRTEAAEDTSGSLCSGGAELASAVASEVVDSHLSGIAFGYDLAVDGGDREIPLLYVVQDILFRPEAHGL